MYMSLSLGRTRNDYDDDTKSSNNFNNSKFKIFLPKLKRSFITYFNGSRTFRRGSLRVACTMADGRCALTEYWV